MSYGNASPAPHPELDALLEQVEARFGIQVSIQKRVLLAARLTRLMYGEGYQRFDRFYRERLAEPEPALLRALASLVATNHTYFWREPSHFAFFRQVVLTERIRAAEEGAERDLRVWCAAAATGEEPYTLGMIQRDVLGAAHPRWRAGVLATDLDQEAIAAAAQGLYAAENAERLPEGLRRRYLEHQADGGYAVRSVLRDSLVLRPFNLTWERYLFRGRFHAIFCRNVLLYFSQDTKDAVVKRLYGATAPGGYLFLGQTETLGRGLSPFTYVRPGIYRRSS